VSPIGLDEPVGAFHSCHAAAFAIRAALPPLETAFFEQLHRRVELFKKYSRETLPSAQTQESPDLAGPEDCCHHRVVRRQFEALIADHPNLP
jgi:hypothetical protein